MLIIRLLTFDESHINLQCNSASLSNLSSSSSVQLIQLSYLVAVRCFCISNVFERWSYPDDCCLEYFSQLKDTKFLSLFIKIFYSLHFCSVIHILLHSSRLYMYLCRPVVNKVYSIWFGPFRSYNFHIVYVGTSTRPKKTLCSLIPARVIPVAIAGVADKMTKNSIRIFANRDLRSQRIPNVTFHWRDEVSGNPQNYVNQSVRWIQWKFYRSFSLFLDLWENMYVPRK